ncbi:MAG: hypothetical protein MUC59_13630 [Saprospiraceae bacterium]|jgi:hypothetical protein|nr:hypothetical protein [Saprospiraceae bacterium]
MVEVTIRTDNELALQKLLDFISTLGFQVVGKKQVKNGKGKSKAVKAGEQDLTELPIVWAEEPDVMALAGIWEGQEIDPEQLRKDAWGGRL